MQKSESSNLGQWMEKSFFRKGRSKNNMQDIILYTD
jgi:hypothetical protein